MRRDRAQERAARLERKESASILSAAHWIRPWLGGCVVVGLSLLALGLAAQVENATAALLLALVLVAAIVGGGIWTFGEQAMPTAGLAVLSVLAVGAPLRFVLPRPATVHEFPPGTFILREDLAGSHTTFGGKNRRPATHHVVPVVPATWTVGGPLTVWAVDPPPGALKPPLHRALRLAIGFLPDGVDAWQDACERHHLSCGGARPDFVEFTADPEGQDAGRVALLAWMVVGLMATWVLGVPVMRALRRLRRSPEER